MKVWRVSTVEAFRQFEQDEDADIDGMVLKLRGEDAPSARMLAGTALHAALEHVEPGFEGFTLEANGYTFHFREDIELAVTETRELRASKVYVVDGEPICISGQVDAIEARRIEDHKSTGRFDAERYFDGYQWRLYLDIFEADHFRWNVFEVAETDDPLVWQVNGFHRLDQYRYPTMQADCQSLVERFARFVRNVAIAQAVEQRVDPGPRQDGEQDAGSIPAGDSQTDPEAEREAIAQKKADWLLAITNSATVGELDATAKKALAWAPTPEIKQEIETAAAAVRAAIEKKAKK